MVIRTGTLQKLKQQVVREAIWNAAIDLFTKQGFDETTVDDIAEAAYFSPSLTTVRQPLRELGILAVQTLLAQIEGSPKAVPGNMITLPAELVVHCSTMVSWPGDRGMALR